MLTHFHSFPSVRPASVDVQETGYLHLRYLQGCLRDSAAILWADGEWNGKQEVQQVVNCGKYSWKYWKMSV